MGFEPGRLSHHSGKKAGLSRERKAGGSCVPNYLRRKWYLCSATTVEKGEGAEAEEEGGAWLGDNGGLKGDGGDIEGIAKLVRGTIALLNEDAVSVWSDEGTKGLAAAR